MESNTWRDSDLGRGTKSSQSSDYSSESFNSIIFEAAVYIWKRLVSTEAMVLFNKMVPPKTNILFISEIAVNPDPFGNEDRPDLRDGQYEDKMGDP